jgi:isopentenyldiphosphate isomerase
VSYLQRIRACNHWNPDNFTPFVIEGRQFGWIKHAFATVLSGYPETFMVSASQVELNPLLERFEQRTAQVTDTLERLIKRGEIGPFHGERYPVVTRYGQSPAFLLDRSAVPRFGLRAFGQHLNGYTQTDKGLSLWIGKRAADRGVFPNRFDNMVAGGLPHGIKLSDNLAKECMEEAGIAERVAANAKPVGEISYCCETEIGLKPDTLFCYDLSLPSSFVPCCTDGEVAGFYLWPVEEVARVVRETEQFKPNCNLVIIDFLLRHNQHGLSDESYLTIKNALKGDTLPY